MLLLPLALEHMSIASVSYIQSHNSSSLLIDRTGKYWAVWLLQQTPDTVYLLGSNCYNRYQRECKSVSGMEAEDASVLSARA